MGLFDDIMGFTPLGFLSQQQADRSNNAQAAQRAQYQALYQQALNQYSGINPNVSSAIPRRGYSTAPGLGSAAMPQLGQFLGGNAGIGAPGSGLSSYFGGSGGPMRAGGSSLMAQSGPSYNYSSMTPAAYSGPMGGPGIQDSASGYDPSLGFAGLDPTTYNVDAIRALNPNMSLAGLQALPDNPIDIGALQGLSSGIDVGAFYGINPGVSAPVEQLVSQGSTELNNADPATRIAQMEALGELQKTYKAGGLSPQDTARMMQIRDAQEQSARASQALVSQQAQRQGMGNSPAALAQMALAGQNEAQRSGQNWTQIGGIAAQNRLAAINQAGALAGQVRGQDYVPLAAQDAINQFNTSNAQGVNARNAASNLAAQQYSVNNAIARAHGITGAQQGVDSFNLGKAGLIDTAQMGNANYGLSKQNALYGANAGNYDRSLGQQNAIGYAGAQNYQQQQQQMKDQVAQQQQDFNNQLALAQGRAGIYSQNAGATAGQPAQQDWLNNYVKAGAQLAPYMAAM